jgi:hypothetical protein
MKPMGAKTCEGSPCAFYDEARGLVIVVYGDDFIAVGGGEALLAFEAELNQHLSMVRKALIGPDHSDDKSGSMLNRIITLAEDGLLWEADPRHAELIIGELGLEAARPQNSPRSSRDDLADTEALNPEAATAFRGVTARVNYLALDRPELQHAAERLAASLSKPTELTNTKTKRLGRREETKRT